MLRLLWNLTLCLLYMLIVVYLISLLAAFLYVASGAAN